MISFFIITISKYIIAKTAKKVGNATTNLVKNSIIKELEKLFPGSSISNDIRNVPMHITEYIKKIIHVVKNLYSNMVLFSIPKVIEFLNVLFLNSSEKFGKNNIIKVGRNHLRYIGIPQGILFGCEFLYNTCYPRRS